MKKSAASGRGSALKVKFNQQRLLAKENLVENVKKNNIHTYEEKKSSFPPQSSWGSHITQEKWEPGFLSLEYVVTWIIWLDSFIFFLQYIFVKSLFFVRICCRNRNIGIAMTQAYIQDVLTVQYTRR